MPCAVILVVPSQTRVTAPARYPLREVPGANKTGPPLVRYKSQGLNWYRLGAPVESSVIFLMGAKQKAGSRACPTSPLFLLLLRLCSHVADYVRGGAPAASNPRRVSLIYYLSAISHVGQVNGELT